LELEKLEKLGKPYILYPGFSMIRKGQDTPLYQALPMIPQPLLQPPMPPKPQTSLALAVATNVLAPQQIMLSQIPQQIPHGTVRHEILTMSGEHTVYITLEPPGGAKYWLQLSGFTPNAVRGSLPVTGNVFTPTIRSGRTYSDLIDNQPQPHQRRYSNSLLVQPPPPPSPSQHQQQLQEQLQTQQAKSGIISAPFTDVCDVCALSLQSSSDSVSTCSICHLSVHHSCYGLPYGDKGSNGKQYKTWKCASCSAANDSQSTNAIALPTCIFCDQTIGMMKKTTNGTDWAHMLCAFYLPQIAFQDIYTSSNIGSIDKFGFRTSIDRVLEEIKTVSQEEAKNGDADQSSKTNIEEKDRDDKKAEDKNDAPNVHNTTTSMKSTTSTTSEESATNTSNDGADPTTVAAAAALVEAVSSSNPAVSTSLPISTHECVVCNKVTGLTLLCDAAGCNQRYHPRCAFNNSQLMFCEGIHDHRAIFRTLCRDHTDYALEKSKHLVKIKRKESRIHKSKVSSAWSSSSSSSSPSLTAQTGYKSNTSSYVHAPILPVSPSARKSVDQLPPHSNHIITSLTLTDVSKEEEVQFLQDLTGYHLRKDLQTKIMVSRFFNLQTTSAGLIGLIVSLSFSF
jgi:hypothetical protein